MTQDYAMTRRQQYLREIQRRAHWRRVRTVVGLYLLGGLTLGLVLLALADALTWLLNLVRR